MEWEKMFSSDICDKWLMSKEYKELIQFRKNSYISRKKEEITERKKKEKQQITQSKHGQRT